uniref:Endoplasmic reticulum-based factor for assembly of V-ATPase n=1 Tax=Anopheles epiroticus TaxID=199890 RepID=A0A182PKZ3_9DIPT
MSDTLDKLPIVDPTVRIVPSKELSKFIATKLSKVSPSTPVAVRDICATFNPGRRGAKFTNQTGNSSPGKQQNMNIDFTEQERNIISQMIATLNERTQHEPGTLDCGLSSEQEQREDGDSGPTLNLADVKWLYKRLQELRQTDASVPYLHTLLAGCQLRLPQNPIRERNPELEARCQRLRKEQEDREYHRMTKNVDSIRKHMPEETLSYQMKQINRHLIAVAQFLFSVAAGFAFGFIGIELLIGQLDFGFRLLLGIIIALIIALAEIYFLAKKLNEEYELPPPQARIAKETSTMPNGVQLTGKQHQE